MSRDQSKARLHWIVGCQNKQCENKDAGGKVRFLRRAPSQLLVYLRNMTQFLINRVKAWMPHLLWKVTRAMNIFEHTLSKCVWNYAIGKKTKKQKKNKQNNRKRKQKKSKYGTENFPLLSSGYILINNGNKTKWSPIRSVIIQNRTTESDFFISVEYDYGQNWTTPSPVNN